MGRRTFKPPVDDDLVELLRLGIDCNAAAATRIDADRVTIEMLRQREADTTHRADARLHEAEAQIAGLEKLLFYRRRARFRENPVINVENFPQKQAGDMTSLMSLLVCDNCQRQWVALYASDSTVADLYCPYCGGVSLADCQGEREIIFYEHDMH